MQKDKTKLSVILELKMGNYLVFTSIKLLELRHDRCPVAISLPFRKIELLAIFVKKKEPSPSSFIRA